MRSWLLLLLLCLPAYLVWLAVKAVKTGRVEHWWRGQNQVFHRHSDPLMFWFLTATLIGLSIVIGSSIIVASLSQFEP
jgi:hypothetical protein